LTSTSTELDSSVFKMLQEVWQSSLCQELTQAAGEEFTARLLDSKPITIQHEASRAWALFSPPAGLMGEIGFSVSPSDALVLSGLVLGKTPEESAGMDRRDDLVAEFFRGVIEAAASALGPKTTERVEFQSRGTEPPSWQAASGFRLEVHGPNTPPLEVWIAWDEGFAQSATQLLAGSSPEESEVAPRPNPASLGEDNIGLFLDIELEASLRFGEREMMLREILNLNSGSIIELNRRVNEPVELLVRGKVVAKGEVVVVDGNYALRVTQIVNQADRMSSIRGR